MTAAVACGLHYCGPPPPQAAFPNGRLRPVGSENRSTQALAGQAAQPLAPKRISLVTCHLHQRLIAHGEHLTHRCSGWTEDLHR